LKSNENQTELYEIACQLMKDYKILTTYDSEEMFIYEDGYFKPYAQTKVKEIIDTALGEDATESRVLEVVNHIKRKTYENREALNEINLRYLNFKNGVYDLQEKKLMPHAWNYCFPFIIPHNYNPEATEPTQIDTFFKQVLPGENVSLAYELFAYSLWRYNPFKLAFMLYGNTNTGKTTFCNLFTEVMGKENVCNIELQALDEDRHASIQLFGKHANLFDDLPSRAVKQTGVFKAITGNGTIQGQHKFKNRVGFRAYAKLIFATNQIPRPMDDSDAYYDRWVLLNFPNQFKKNNPIELESVLYDEQEIEGLIKKIVELLPELLKNGFTYPLDTEEKRRLYLKLSDPAGTFLGELTEFEANKATPKDELYAEFMEYCKKHKQGVISEKSFSRIIYSQYPKIEEARLRMQLIEDRKRCWVGLKYIGVREITFDPR
jgi:putative DNA primase/helicase